MNKKERKFFYPLFTNPNENIQFKCKYDFLIFYDLF